MSYNIHNVTCKPLDVGNGILSTVRFSQRPRWPTLFCKLYRRSVVGQFDKLTHYPTLRIRSRLLRYSNEQRFRSSASKSLPLRPYQVRNIAAATVATFLSWSHHCDGDRTASP